MSDRQQVVLGNGVLGRAVARRLVARGARPLLLSRRGSREPGCANIACDLAEPGQLARHLDRRCTLFMCAAPAYWMWQLEFPRIRRGIEAACVGRELDIVLADNLYAYGRVAGEIDEASAFRPCSDQGRARQAVAGRLMALDAEHGTRVAVVRAADFFGPGVERSVLGRRVIQHALTGRKLFALGDPEVAHACTYLPDFAEAMVTLGGRDDAFGGNWHAPSHNLPSMRAFLSLVAAAAGQPLRLRSLPRWRMALIGVIDPTMRALQEMCYLYETPHRLSFAHTAARFGLAPTPLAEAVAGTIRDALSGRGVQPSRAMK